MNSNLPLRTASGRPKEILRLEVDFIATGASVQVPIRKLARAPGHVSAIESSIHFRRAFETSRRRVLRWWGLAWVLSWLALLLLGQPTNPPSNGPSPPPASVVIEAAGQVEYLTSGQAQWRPASRGLALQPGDRLRTREQSRAAIQLADRSLIRLNERTTLELLPPRGTEKRRFRLPFGSIYFFDREKPADVEFDTPLAAGAIRGTEFWLDAEAGAASVRLGLMEGLVALRTVDNREVDLQRGEEVKLAPDRPPVKKALRQGRSKIQWALYYPAVVDPAELTLNPNEKSALSDVLKEYHDGDLLGALAAWPATQHGGSAGQRILRAQEELAVGRVEEAEGLLVGLPDHRRAMALRQLIAVVRDAGSETPAPGDSEAESVGVDRGGLSASELLARSYARQARADLLGARADARRGTELAPELGFAHARLAELEFAFGYRRAALAGLERALRLSPRLASARAVQGFVRLEQGEIATALQSFDAARELDAALGSAWLGRGLCLMRGGALAEARASLQVAAALEPQRGLFYGGWHHAWSPNHHTLLLVSRLEDRFSLLDPRSDQVFLFQAGGVTQAVQSPPLGPPFTNDFFSRFSLYSVELQQILETRHHSLILGGRWQSGEVAARADLSRPPNGIVTSQQEQGAFWRGSAYGYYSWRPVDSLSLIGGVAYDRLETPENTDFPPISCSATMSQRARATV